VFVHGVGALAPTGSRWHTSEYMALHPQFPVSPYAPLVPKQRWFPADEALRSTAHDKLLLPLVAKVREEVLAWRHRDDAASFTEYRG